MESLELEKIGEKREKKKLAQAKMGRSSSRVDKTNNSIAATHVVAIGLKCRCYRGCEN